jgi:hypothetical protein
VSYIVAKADPATGLLDHYWRANVALLGQIQVGERILPYSVSLHKVTVEDSKLVRWELDRSELKAFLQEVLAQPITQRALQADPNLSSTCTMWKKTDDYPYIPKVFSLLCRPSGATRPSNTR